MKDFLSRALNFAHLRGAQYADIRVVDKRNEFIQVKNGQPESLKNFTTFGFGVRVLVNGSWGFASSSRLNEAELDRVVQLAIEIGKASTLVQKQRVNLGPAVTSQGVYCTPVAVDPFNVSLDEKMAVLMAADKEMGQRKRG